MLTPHRPGGIIKGPDSTERTPALNRAKGTRAVSDALGTRSGMLPRRRDAAEAEAERHADASPVMKSQLRRRSDLQEELDSARRDRAASALREPGFVEDEPEDGVPTPRPKVPLSAVPIRIVSDRELLMLPLDHRAGFVLSHVDGTSDVRTLLDVCRLTHDELIEVVEQLIALRAILLT